MGRRALSFVGSKCRFFSLSCLWFLLPWFVSRIKGLHMALSYLTALPHMQKNRPDHSKLWEGIQPSLSLDMVSSLLEGAFPTRNLQLLPEVVPVKALPFYYVACITVLRDISVASLFSSAGKTLVDLFRTRLTYWILQLCSGASCRIPCHVSELQVIAGMVCGVPSSSMSRINTSLSLDQID